MVSSLEVPRDEKVVDKDSVTGSTGGSTVADPPMGSLVGEAAALLKSLHALKLKAVRLKFLDGVGEKKATEAFGMVGRLTLLELPDLVN